MERRRRTIPRAEEIIGEWGVRDVTPASAAERERLAAEHDLNPLVGTPQKRRLRPFGAPAHLYLASLGGPLPYMQRARLIDEEIARHEQQLAEAYAFHRDDPAGWRRLAGRWNFTEVNELIERHNRWYPIEARLPMDPRTKDYVKVGGKPYWREPLDAAWILARFP